MATKSKLPTMHTAGIFSDMTVDGPEIGTLVVIVDRAKNLPNRKTIGKQDPYCAARLGKEAKKTETDKRGGQTPRWDQELRFTVHDSPDYYQLKVSVFNDDKRTDLIGETWVNLQDVIIPGGGQSDIWHSLNCKGKYAGEIRIEITYYDLRPKPEKPEKKEPKQPSAIPVTTFVHDHGSVSGTGSVSGSVGGPRQLKAVKRRPLPSDPITGAAAQPPAPAPAVSPQPEPAQTQTPPRGYQPPSVADHVQSTPRGYREHPTAIHDHVQTPPRGYQNPPTAIPDHMQTPPQGYPMSPNGMQDLAQTSPRGYQNPPVIQDQPLPSPRGYHSPGMPQEQAHTPQRGYQSNGYISDHSPLQRVEYNTPSNRYSPQQEYDVSPGGNGYGTSQGMMTASPSSQLMANNDMYDMYDPMGRNDYEQSQDMARYPSQQESFDPHDNYGPRRIGYEAPQPNPYDLPLSPGPPPPPPVHARKHASSAPIAQPKAIHGRPVSGGNTNPYDTPVDHAMLAYSQAPPTSTYQAYSPTKNEDQFRNSANGQSYQRDPRRQNSYDARFNGSHESMQPTVEDAPPTPAPSGYALTHRNTASGGFPPQQPVQPQQHPEMYDNHTSTGPLSLRTRPSRNSISTVPSHGYSNSSQGYAPSSSMSSFRDGGSISSRTSYNGLPPNRHDRSQSLNDTAGDYGLPEMPPTLVPGMDPMIAKEISDRIYHEKRASYSQSSQRGRHQERQQYQQTQPSPLSYHDSAAVVPYSPSAAHYDGQGSYSTAMVPVKPRGVSPNPSMNRKAVSPNPPVNHRGVSPNPSMNRRAVSPNPGMARRGTSPNPSVMRKSVSPAPEARRLSGIAFGPESYDVFNPNLTGSKSAGSLSAAYEKEDPDAKIITHDGREIDPSDHIPESNYAPLLEQKGPKYASQMPDRNYRPPPAQQPAPTTRKLAHRQAGRPQSMAITSPIYFSGGTPDHPPAATGRNKLQKKANRMSAQPAYHSSPAVPIYQDPNYRSARSPQRPSTAEYANENYPPQNYAYGSSPGGGGYRGPVGPPLPAKVPMALPAPGSRGGAPGGGDSWALLEEMKNIDLGSGRARRRGY
ncbi:Contractile actomyosin ring interacting protein [Clarireedia jacksonii]